MVLDPNIKKYTPEQLRRWATIFELEADDGMKNAEVRAERFRAKAKRYLRRAKVLEKSIAE